MQLPVWLETLVHDVRLGLRVWLRRPVVALAAVVTIALGAGMNIAVFQAIWTVLLKPLPYTDPERLVQVWIDDGKTERNAPPNTLIDRWREGSRAFTHVASYRPWRVTVANGGEAEQVFAGLVSAEFFDTFGTRLLAGRAFLPAEVKPGADNAILLRESYWKRRFAGDYAMLGRDVTVEGMLFRIIGIVPDSFGGAGITQVRLRDEPAEAEVYLPITRARVAGWRNPVHTSFVVGRLSSATTLAQAAAELTSIAAPPERGRIWLSPLQDEVGRRLRTALFALLAATGCVLLIACANLANLLLSQAIRRRRELSVRSALGAGRARIVRLLVTEAVLLLVAGAAVGIALARVVSQTIRALYPEAVPRAAEAGFEWRVYLAALGVTMFVGLLFSALPACRVTGDRSDTNLRVGSLWMSRETRRWAGVMVAVQVGLTAVVLVAAGLLFRSFLLLRGVDVGFTRDQVITASVDLPEARFKTREARGRFAAEWVERLNAIPGVSAAAVSISLPLRYTTLLDLRIRIPGRPSDDAVATRAVGGPYFEALGMSFVAGRVFDEQRAEVVVNETFVRNFLKQSSAVGTVLGTGPRSMTITGVVKDVRHVGLREAVRPEMFVPFASFPLNPVDTVVRSALPPAQVAAAMRTALRSIDGQIALGRVLTMDEVVGSQLARPRFQAALTGLFALVAILLAAVGTYAVIAHNVRSRLPEFGLRRALGAGTPNLLRLVLWDGMKAPLAGLAVGLAAGGLVAGRYLQTLLFGLEPHDPLVLASTALLLALTALLACIVPGFWATRVEPVEALRQE